jgi:hypothetical protein
MRYNNESLLRLDSKFRTENVFFKKFEINLLTISTKKLTEKKIWPWISQVFWESFFFKQWWKHLVRSFIFKTSIFGVYTRGGQTFCLQAKLKRKISQKSKKTWQKLFAMFFIIWGLNDANLKCFLRQIIFYV